MVDLTGLDSFSLSSLMSGESSNQAETKADGVVSYAPINRFHESPHNARKRFDPEKLQELVDSINAINPKTGERRGIKQPLSVKPHPDIPGDFIINGGHRRYRAGKIAELEVLPYFLDEEADDFDNVVDNLIRDGLNHYEMAVVIKDKLDKGMKAGEIASQLGKPNSFVSDYSIFFDLPDCISDLYQEGLCNSMKVLAILFRAYKKGFEEEITNWCLSVKYEITKAQVEEFVRSLKEKGAESDTQNEIPVNADKLFDKPESFEETPENDHAEDGNNEHDDSLDDQADELLQSEEDKEKIKKPLIQVKHDDREAQLLIKKRAAYGLAWIKYTDDGDEMEVDVNEIKLVAVIES